MATDPNGEVATMTVILVVGGVAIATAYSARFVDWGTDSLSTTEQKLLKTLLQSLIDCGDMEVKYRLEAMKIVGKYEKGKLDSEWESRTKENYWGGTRTYLSSNFFSRGGSPGWLMGTMYRTLLHESEHAAQEKAGEVIGTPSSEVLATNYTQGKLLEMACCLEICDYMRLATTPSGCCQPCDE